MERTTARESAATSNNIRGKRRAFAGLAGLARAQWLARPAQLRKQTLRRDLSRFGAIRGELEASELSRGGGFVDGVVVVVVVVAGRHFLCFRKRRKARRRGAKRGASQSQPEPASVYEEGRTLDLLLPS